MTAVAHGGDEPNAERLISLARTFTRSAANLVLDVGKPGDWDDGRSGCFSLSKIGERFHLWYMGAGGKNPWRIGLGHIGGRSALGAMFVESGAVGGRSRTVG